MATCLKMRTRSLPDTLYLDANDTVTDTGTGDGVGSATSLQFLLRDLKSEKSRTEIEFTIDDGKTDAKEYVIKQGDSFPHRAKTEGEVCTYLIGEIIYHLIDKNEKDIHN